MRTGSLFLPILGGALACSLVVDAGREQCAADADCVGHYPGLSAVCAGGECRAVTGGAGAGDGAPPAPEDPVWGCLGNVPPPPAEETVPSVTIRAAFFSLITNAYLPGLSAKACSNLDQACATPVPGTLTQTDDAGVATMQVPHGFRGYIDVVPSTDALVPVIRPILPVPDTSVTDETTTFAERSPMFTWFDFTALAESVGKKANPEYGHFFFTAVDCSGNNAANAIMLAEARALTNDTFTYYTDAAGLPSITPRQTTSSGHGGFVNVSPGSATFTLMLDDGRRVGTETVVIRPGTITIVRFRPTT